MSGPPEHITGRCLCGSVEYSAEAQPVVQAVCHCTDCQRQTGGPFTVVVGVPLAAFSIEGSTLASYATTGEDHGADTQRSFCSACGSPLFSISAVSPELALIKAGTMETVGIEPTSAIAYEWLLRA